MKRANGTGSVFKLSGKRRNPWVARVTQGFDAKGRQKYINLGYYKTKREAENELLSYNSNPYDANLKKITFLEVFEKFIEIQKNKGVAKSTLDGYKTFKKRCGEKLMNVKMQELKTLQLQNSMDELVKRGLASESLRVHKVILVSIFKLAMKLDIVQKNYASFIAIPKSKPVLIRRIFTESEIEKLWNCVEIKNVDIVLILIFTGFRVNELLNMQRENVDLENRCLKGGSKTKAGKNRVVPIHPKIFELIKNKYDNTNDYLFLNHFKRKMSYMTFYQRFGKMMEMLDMKHTIHDTRHTFATMISEASQNQKAITEMIGHASISMTEKYWHTNLEKMRKELEKIN